MILIIFNVVNKHAVLCYLMVFYVPGTRCPVLNYRAIFYIYFSCNKLKKAAKNKKIFRIHNDISFMHI